MPVQLFNLSDHDEVINVEEVEGIDYFELNIGINEKGKLKAYKTVKEDLLKVKTNSLSELMIFTNIGNVYKIPVFLMKKLMEEEVSVETFVGALDKKEKVVTLMSVNSYEEDTVVYLFSKKGMVKKTLLKEFEGDVLKQACYKFKFEDDEVVAADINKIKLGYLVMITKKGMAIRFPVENVNPMGKIASGVTGISLREDDEVIFGKFTSDYVEAGGNTIVLTTNSKQKENINIKDIKLQNRAGRGNNMIVLVLGDEIKNINIDN